MDPKNILLKKTLGTGRSIKGFAEFFEFFRRAVHLIGIEEDKAEATAELLMRYFLKDFGGCQYYIPLAKVSSNSDKWLECYEKYKKGIYTIERIAALLGVSRRHVYRTLKEIGEREREAKKPTQQFTGGGRVNPN